MSKYLSRKKSLGNNYRTAIIAAKVNIAFNSARRKLNIFSYVHKKPPIFTDKRCHNKNEKKNFSERFPNIDYLSLFTIAKVSIVFVSTKSMS